jgi:hypothetical protein
VALALVERVAADLGDDAVVQFKIIFDIADIGSVHPAFQY